MSFRPFKHLSNKLKGNSSGAPAENGSKNSPELGGASSASLHEAQELHNAQLHPDAHPEGGLSPNNDDLMREQREAITSWITSMGKKIFQGSFNLISTPFPVIMFEPRSYLEKLADVWVYPHYLQQASVAPDPLERMKLVVTWFIAGLHHGFEKWKKPFNPILGETWQAGLSDGSQMFMEQISHHPPVTAFNLEGPGKAYRFTGLSQPNVAIVLKYYGFKTMAKGFRHLDFADGSRIDIHYPGYYIKGVVYSPRPRAEVDGSAIFTDLKNRIRAVVRFGPNKGARAPILRRSDAVIGEIIEMEGAPTVEVPQTIPEANELCAESSSDLDPSAERDLAQVDSEDFESASESDFGLRDLHAAAEEQRETDSPVASSRHQRSTSQHRVLSDAATMAAISYAGENHAAVASPPTYDMGQYYITEPATGHDRPSAPAGSSGSSSQVQALNAPQQPRLSKTPNPSTTPTSSATPLPTSPAKRLSEPGRSSGSVVLQKAPEATVGSASGLLSGFSRMMGRGTSSTSTAGPDPAEVAGVLLARIEGSWLSHVNIDGQRFWTLMEETPDQWTPAAHVLPSDSRFRQDLVMIKQGDIKAAQKWKEELENLQRRDKKLREAGGSFTGRH